MPAQIVDPEYRDRGLETRGSDGIRRFGKNGHCATLDGHRRKIDTVRGAALERDERIARTHAARVQGEAGHDDVVRHRLDHAGQEIAQGHARRHGAVPPLAASTPAPAAGLPPITSCGSTLSGVISSRRNAPFMTFWNTGAATAVPKYAPCEPRTTTAPTRRGLLVGAMPTNNEL